MKSSKEFGKFDKTMGQLLKVPHSQVKAKLEAEKTAKRRKPKRASASRDSGVGGRDSGGN